MSRYAWVSSRHKMTGLASYYSSSLSQAAARAIGVDRAEDRTVDFRIVALPGEKPLSVEIAAGR